MRRSPAAFLLALLLLLPACGRREEEGAVAIVAAASLRKVLPVLIEAYGETPGAAPIGTPGYGASGTLRQQVEGGAPVDGVLLASARDVDLLVERGAVEGGSRAVVAVNALVLIAAAERPGLTFETIDEVPPGATIAVGEPTSVPVGWYAREALAALGKWDALAGRLAYGGDVSQVLAWVRRDEAWAGIAYRTEVQGVEGVVVLDEARGAWAPRPQVVAAVVKGAAQAEGARAFVAFLSTEAAQAILREHGFLAPSP